MANGLRPLDTSFLTDTSASRFAGQQIGAGLEALGAGIARGQQAIREEERADRELTLREEAQEQATLIQNKRLQLDQANAMMDVDPITGAKLLSQAIDLDEEKVIGNINEFNNIRTRVNAVSNDPNLSPGDKEDQINTLVATARSKFGLKANSKDFNKFVDQSIKNAGILSGKEKFDRSAKLRGEFIDLSTDFHKQQVAWNKIQGIGKEVSPIGDISLIVQFMKLIDPSSTVREGEVNTVRDAAALLDRLTKGRIKKVITGEILLPEQRADLLKRAQTLFNGSKKEHDVNKGKYTKLAKVFGLDPETVTLDFETARKAAQELDTENENRGGNLDVEIVDPAPPDQQLQPSGNLQIGTTDPAQMTDEQKRSEIEQLKLLLGK